MDSYRPRQIALANQIARLAAIVVKTEFEWELNGVLRRRSLVEAGTKVGPDQLGSLI